MTSSRSNRVEVPEAKAAMDSSDKELANLYSTCCTS